MSGTGSFQPQQSLFTYHIGSDMRISTTESPFLHISTEEKAPEMMKVILNIILTMKPTESHHSLLLIYDGSSLYSMVRLSCDWGQSGEHSRLNHDNMRDESTYLKKEEKEKILLLIFHTKQQNIAKSLPLGLSMLFVFQESYINFKNLIQPYIKSMCLSELDIQKLNTDGIANGIRDNSQRSKTVLLMLSENNVEVVLQAASKYVQWWMIHNILYARHCFS